MHQDTQTDTSCRLAALVNLGCRVNRVEADDIAQSLQACGFQIVDPDLAQLIVVNTCAVTGEAEAKTRKLLRKMLHLPQKPLVIATGCAATLFAQDLQAIDSRLYIETNKSRVVELANKLINQQDILDACACTSQPTTSAITPTGRTRPGIKIQDGCNNRCSYCIVWKARGDARSVDVCDVVAKVKKQVELGAKEIVLTGIDLGNYHARFDACDTQTTWTLARLLDYLLEHTDVKRIRLSSIEPKEATDDLLDVMASSDGRIAPFLHLPLQSGSDSVLQRMQRLYTTQEYLQIADRIRNKIPHIALACDYIVGFPQETDEEFEQGYALCEKLQFSKMHIFRYSSRPGTPAADMDGHVAPEVAKKRAKRLAELAQQMRRDQAKKQLAYPQTVLVERSGRAISGGLFDVLVDTKYAYDELVVVHPHSICEKATLDARQLDL